MRERLPLPRRQLTAWAPPRGSPNLRLASGLFLEKGDNGRLNLPHWDLYQSLLVDRLRYYLEQEGDPEAAAYEASVRLHDQSLLAWPTRDPKEFLDLVYSSQDLQSWLVVNGLRVPVRNSPEQPGLVPLLVNSGLQEWAAALAPSSEPEHPL